VEKIADINEKSLIYHTVKRIIDVSGSIFGIILLSPILLIVMIAIKLDSKGPIIFSQERVGRDHKHFKMYKFRSMRLNAETELDKLKGKNEMGGPMFKMKEDPRVTKVGKFIRRTSIDELPQLINVIKGEMSLVGPRPSLPSEVCKFEPWMLQRLQAKPGLTCYWQVRGRNDIGFKEWMELDCKYIVNRNITTDIGLIFKTIRMLFGDIHAR
jgi:lipopolysaccharide/colanic/teichoic acid biosynthesis glycosyltransferase